VTGTGGLARRLDAVPPFPNVDAVATVGILGLRGAAGPMPGARPQVEAIANPYGALSPRAHVPADGRGNSRPLQRAIASGSAGDPAASAEVALQVPRGNTP
jgi:hypothetical protein